MPVLEKVLFDQITLEKSTLDLEKKDIENTLEDIAKKHERFTPLKKKKSN